MPTLQQVDPQQATGKTKQIFDSLEKKLGVVPNLTKVLANSPASLNAYASFAGALEAGELSPRLRQLLALAVGNQNACTYCLSAHTAIGKLIGVSEDDLAAAQTGQAADPKERAAVEFAQAVVRQRGQVSPDAVVKLKNTGFSEGQIVEIIAHVALNTFTNYINLVADTVIDFPVVQPVETVAA